MSQLSLNGSIRKEVAMCDWFKLIHHFPLSSWKQAVPKLVPTSDSLYSLNPKTSKVGYGHLCLSKPFYYRGLLSQQHKKPLSVPMVSSKSVDYPSLKVRINLYGSSVCMLVCVLLALLVLMEAWRKPPNSLELQSQMVVSQHMGSGNRTQVFWKSIQAPLTI